MKSKLQLVITCLLLGVMLVMSAFVARPALADTVPLCSNGLLQNIYFNQFTGQNNTYYGDPIPANWTLTGGGQIGSTVAYNPFNPANGTRVGYVINMTSGSTTPTTMYQQVNNIVAGDTYSMTFYAGTHDPSGHPTIAIRFYNSSGTELSNAAVYTITHDIDGGDLDGPHQLITVAPPNVSSLRVIFTDPGTSGIGAKGSSMCLQQFTSDFGDAPDTGSATGQGNYNTLSTDNGPSHAVISTLTLGSLIDAEGGTLQNTAATADNADNLNDEDGISSRPSITPNSTSVQLTVKVYNHTGGNATLACWIDFNRDGDFLDTGERAFTTIPNSTNANPQSFTLTFSGFAAPTLGVTYIRCRVAIDPSDVASPTGPAESGEVEDYQVTITSNPTATTLLKFGGSGASKQAKLNWKTGSEDDLIGFNLWRQTGKNGKWVQVNIGFIPARHMGQAIGGSYKFTDTTAKRGKTYSYKLQLVLRNAQPLWSSPLQLRVAQGH